MGSRRGDRIVSNAYWQVELDEQGRLSISYEDSFIIEQLVIFPNNEAYRVYIDDETGAEKAIPVNLTEALRDLVKRIDVAGQEYMKTREWLRGGG